jgi:hypothetical protein
VLEQEFLAIMLGTNRPSVSVAMGSLLPAARHLAFPTRRLSHCRPDPPRYH